MDFCNELDFDNILKLELWPLGSLTVDSHIYEPLDVAKVKKPKGDDIKPIEVVHAPTSDKHIVAEVIKVKSESSRTLPGTVHACEVEFSTYQIEADQLGYIRELEDPHEALVYFFGGQVWLIRTERDAYAKTQKNDGLLTVTMKMKNGQGVTVVEGFENQE